MKQAYLIIAHNKLEQLKFLVSLLDYEKHDIYILFDKKSNISNNQKNDISQVAKKSTVFFTEEIPIYWGDYSLIEAEMMLLKTANKKGSYSMYHLLSGVDLPLESAENLYRFFDKNRAYNFLEVETDEFTQEARRAERVQFYTLFPRLSHRTVKYKGLGYLIVAYRKLEKLLQRILKVNKIAAYNLKVKVGSNWCSLNQEAVTILTKEEALIEKVFTGAFCGDELFVPMILEKNNLLGTLYSHQPHSHLRHIEWTRGHYGSSPYTWTTSDEDIEKLKECKKDGYLFSERKGSLFARKFDLEKYPEMKERIFEVIHYKNNE